MSDVLTIKKLREKLDAWEKDWTEQDVQYLGSFDSQPVITNHFDPQWGTFQGVGAANVLPHWELGLLIISCPEG